MRHPGRDPATAVFPCSCNNFRRHPVGPTVPQASAASISELKYSNPCRIVAGQREYPGPDPESSSHKTHGHTRRESATGKARNPVLTFSRFTEKIVMTK